MHTRVVRACAPRARVACACCACPCCECPCCAPSCWAWGVFQRLSLHKSGNKSFEDWVYSHTLLVQHFLYIQNLLGHRCRMQYCSTFAKSSSDKCLCFVAPDTHCPLFCTCPKHILSLRLLVDCHFLTSSLKRIHIHQSEAQRRPQGPIGHSAGVQGGRGPRTSARQDRVPGQGYFGGGRSADALNAADTL